MVAHLLVQMVGGDHRHRRSDPDRDACSSVSPSPRARDGSSSPTPWARSPSSAWELLIGAVVPTASSGQAIGMLLYFPLLFFAGVYIPLEVMPDGVRTVSGYTPSGATVQALSASWAGEVPADLEPARDGRVRARARIAGHLAVPLGLMPPLRSGATVSEGGSRPPSSMARPSPADPRGSRPRVQARSVRSARIRPTC